MAETLSEKVMKDTLHALEAGGRILWAMRCDQVSGYRYSSRAPIDFVVATLDGDLHAVEVKEVGRPTLPHGQFDEEQRRLLRNLTNAWQLLRFYDGERTRAHSCYWEEWFWLPGRYCPPPDARGSTSLKELVARARSDEYPQIERIAGYDYGERWGLEEDAGLTTRGNASLGLTNIPLGREARATCAVS